MDENIILIVLGQLSIKDATKEDTLPREAQYTHVTTQDVFPGIQSNEAPVEYLLKTAFGSGMAVSRIVYLCSSECLTRAIPSKLLGGPDSNYDADGRMLSTAEFFCERISRYCEENGLAMPKTNAIPFNPERPADSLDGLVVHLRMGTRVSIDITGGPRDAVILLSLAAQIIKIGTGGTSIGDIVYANFNEKKIYEQGNTFELIDLVNAIGSFTDYGRADRLKAFFEGDPYVKEPTKRLCDSLEEFSDSLALCRVENIGEKVSCIQRYLDEAEEYFRDFKDKYSLYTSAIEQIGGESSIRRMSFEESLEQIERLHDDVLFSELDKTQLLAKLLELRETALMKRTEFLFLSLIPAIRDGFVRRVDNRGQLLFETIKWCNDRQMVQQALGIYREYVPKYVVDQGYISAKRGDKKPEVWLKALSNVASEEAKKYVDIAKIDADIRWGFREQGLIAIDNRGLDDLRGAFLLLHPGRYLKDEYATVDIDRENQLSAILVWFRYIWLVRNFTMHVSEPDDRFFGFMAVFKNVYGEKRYAESYALPDIQHDIDLALTFIGPNNDEQQVEADWGKVIDALAENARALPIDEYNQLIDDIRMKKTVDAPYVFENEVPNLLKDAQGGFTGIIASSEDVFASELCIEIRDTPENEMRYKRIKKQGGIHSMRWNGDPWEELKDKLVAYGQRMQTSYVVWDDFFKQNHLPGKSAYGLGAKAKISTLFNKLAKEDANEFALSPCMKCLKPLRVVDVPVTMEPLEEKNLGDSALKQAISKQKPSKKKRRSAERSMRGLGSSVSSRLDPEMLAKLNAMREEA